MPDMLVKLYELPDESALLEELSSQGLAVRRAMARRVAIVLVSTVKTVRAARRVTGRLSPAHRVMKPVGASVPSGARRPVVAPRGLVRFAASRVARVPRGASPLEGGPPGENPVVDLRAASVRRVIGVKPRCASWGDALAGAA